MRSLLVLFAIGGTVLAQSPPSNSSTPGAQSIINSMLASNPQAAPPVATSPGQLPELKLTLPPSLASTPMTASQAIITVTGSASPCSVPLLEARIRDDVHYTMQTIEPPADKIDRMQVAVPALACVEPPR